MSLFRTLLRPTIIQGGGGSSPTWGGEIQRTSLGYNGGGTLTFTLASSVPAGGRTCIVLISESINTFTSVTSGSGYTFTKDNSTTSINLYSTPHALAAGDSIIAITPDGGDWRAAIIFYVANTTDIDVTSVSSDYANVISTAATTSAPTVIVGIGYSWNTGQDSISFDGIESGADYIPWNPYQFHHCYLYYKNVSSAGAQTMGITLASTVNVRNMLTAYK